MKKGLMILAAFITFSVLAGPALEMNKVFIALSDLIPFVSDRSRFMEKKNEAIILEKITQMQKAFKGARHDTLLKEDLFAPSYKLVNENIDDSLSAFKKGKKDYAHWRLREITSLCLDCHTRLPESYASSFQNGALTLDKSKYEGLYNLGIAQMIVRRYSDAKATFTQDIEQRLLKKEVKDLNLPFKEILVIETKVLNQPGNLIAPFEYYLSKKDLPEEMKTDLKKWITRLKYWSTNPVLKKMPSNDKEMSKFIKNEVHPLKKRNYDRELDVDLLMVSGILSHYLFFHPNSKLAPEMSYWLGRSEKFLKRENFFGSGDLFLKQCIRRYPKDPVARECFNEYKESVEFDFSGSGGVDIPEDVQNELKELEKKLKK